MRIFHFDTIRDAFLNYFMEEVLRWQSGPKKGIAELLDVIYLLDYNTGKKNEEHKNQVQLYANALREMTNKDIWAFLVYLSEK